MTEIVCALATLDLPFKKVQHAPKYLEGISMELHPASPVITFHKEIKGKR